MYLNIVLSYLIWIFLLFIYQRLFLPPPLIRVRARWFEITVFPAGSGYCLGPFGLQLISVLANLNPESLFAHKGSLSYRT